MHTLNGFKLVNCRYFMNGGCRLGSRCKYRHERPVSVELCRYFQKGGCWYGESCRWVGHLQHPMPSCKWSWKCNLSSRPQSGIAMFSSLIVQQLLVEDVLHLLSLVLLTLILTGEGHNLLFCRLKWCRGQKAASRDHLRFMSTILKVTRGNRQNSKWFICRRTLL